MRRARSKPTYALIAGALLGLIVMPIALAGAADNPQAMTSSSVKKQVKKLKQQVNQLQQQVEDLSKQPGPQGPSGPQGAPGPSTGPAGGDLTGNYPNPTIGPNAVGAAEIVDGAVGAEELATDSVQADEIRDSAVVHGKIATAAVQTAEILNGAVQADDMGASSVGGLQLKDRTAVVGSGVTVNAGTPQNAEVTCPPQQAVIGAGFAWQKDEANSIISSAPSETDPNRTWVVRGMVDAGSNTLYAWANCLAV